MLKGMSNFWKESSKNADLDILLSEAVSDQNWQASTTTLNAIADSTYDPSNQQRVKQFIWIQLKKASKNWRKALKAMILLEHLLKNSAQSTVADFKNKLYDIKALEDYSYMEEGKDKGLSVREKCKFIIKLLTQQQLLEDERIKARKIRSAMAVNGSNNSININDFNGSKSNNLNGVNYSSYQSSITNNMSGMDLSSIGSAPVKKEQSKKTYHNEGYTGFNHSNKYQLNIAINNKEVSPPKNSFQALASRLKKSQPSILKQPKINLKKPQPKKINQTAKNNVLQSQINSKIPIKTEVTVKSQNNKKQNIDLLDLNLFQRQNKIKQQILDLIQIPLNQNKAVTSNEVKKNEQLNMQYVFINPSPIAKPIFQISLAPPLKKANEGKDKAAKNGQWLSSKEKDLIDLSDFTTQLKKTNDAPKFESPVWDW